MPYIEQKDRERLSPGFGTAEPQSAGELNYCITTLCIDYLNSRVRNYTTLNEIIGALECAKQEFYRRAVVPYEDKKIEQNGDVY